MTAENSLKWAVVDQIARFRAGGSDYPIRDRMDTLRDVANHGAEGGVSGFTYYSETVAFYDANEEAIWERLADDTEEFGYQSALAYMASWPSAHHVWSSDHFKNQLAWYALESIAHDIVQAEEVQA